MRQFLKSLLFITLLFTGAAMVNQQAPVSADSSGCDSYAIVRCGAGSHRELINKINQNAPGDLPGLMANFGLSQADYGTFTREARTGTLYDDGRIVVGGKTVGRSTLNVARVKDGNFNQPVRVNGKTYWGGPFGSTYHADRAEVMVLMKNGVLKFVAISSCGNPQRFTPEKPEPQPEPEYQCKMLKKNEVKGSENTYEFSTNAPSSGGAELVSLTYDFGDGTSRTVNNPDTAVRHTFKKSSTVRVTVKFRVPGNGIKEVTSKDCMTKITVRNTPPPPPEQPQGDGYCSALTAELINEDQRLYRFTANGVTREQATLTRAEFRFSDSDTVMPVQPNGNQAIIEHAFGDAGDYTASATLYFQTPDGKTVSGGCETSLNSPSAPPECPEGTGDGKGGCVELTDTGTGTVVAGVFGGASLTAAIGHYIRRRFLLGL